MRGVRDERARGNVTGSRQLGVTRAPHTLGSVYGASKPVMSQYFLAGYREGGASMLRSGRGRTNAGGDGGEPQSRAQLLKSGAELHCARVRPRRGCLRTVGAI